MNAKLKLKVEELWVEMVPSPEEDCRESLAFLSGKFHEIFRRRRGFENPKVSAEMNKFWAVL